MKKLSAIILAVLMLLSAFPVSAIILETVENSEEFVTVEETVSNDANVMSETSVMPEKYNSTYGELVMYSDFSGESVATPTYSSSNLVIEGLTKATAVDGTVCAVSGSSVGAGAARGIQVKANSGVFAYNDGSAMTGTVTYIAELCVDFSGTASSYFFTGSSIGNSSWEPLATHEAVKNNKTLLLPNVWVASKALKETISGSYTNWALVIATNTQPVYFKNIRVYCKDSNAIILKAASWDNDNIARFVPTETFVFPEFNTHFGDAAVNGTSWTDGTSYYQPGDEVVASTVAGKVFYPVLNTSDLHDDYGYHLTSWNFKSTGEIWESPTNSAAFVNTSGTQLVLRITNGAKTANVIADPTNSSNMVLCVPKSQTNADFIGINVQTKAGSNSSYSTAGKYTVSYRAYLDSETDADLMTAINNSNAKWDTCKANNWTQIINHATLSNIGSIQLYRYSNNVLYDDISVWCYPSNALILRAKENAKYGEMLYADETAVFPATFEEETVEKWTDGTTVYSSGTVIPADACGKTWIPAGDELFAPISLNEYSIRTTGIPGMRFTAFTSETNKLASTEYGFIATLADFMGENSYTSLVFPKSKEGNTAITTGGTGVDTVEIGGTNVRYIYASAFVKDSGVDKFKIRTYNGVDGFQTYAVLVNIPEAQYKSEFVVRPYIVIDGVYYYGTPMVKDIYSLAEEYSGEENEVINQILGK